jgi:hypothetical protein
MAIDPTARRSRRAVLGAALGGAAAAAASGLMAASPALADTGDPAVLGQANTADAATSFENTTDATTAVSLSASHATSGVGIKGQSSEGTGVKGVVGSDDLASDFGLTGVYGFADSTTGLFGVAGEAPDGIALTGVGLVGVLAEGQFGVYGSGVYGVVGDADASGTGVYGFSGSSAAPEPPVGVGVYAAAGSSSQTALQTKGRLRFDRAGKTSMGASARSKTINKPGVTSSSYVIATVQTVVSGVYVQSVKTASGKFTIHLSKAPGKKIYVGYLIIN